MNARSKINVWAIVGAILSGLFVGWITGSWVICIIVIVIAIGLATQDNVIRLEPETNHRPPKVRRWQKKRD